MARQGTLMFLGRGRPRPALDAPRVVAFVHGYGAGGAVFDPLRRAVEGELGLPTLDFTYRSSWPFSRVLDALDAELTRVGDAELDLVGHSLGGLVARWWVQEMGGAERTRRVVTLATPHAGTRSARVAPGPLRAALMPQGAIVRRLAAGRHLDPDRYEVLEASNGGWYFNVKAANGRVVGTSEVYASRSNAERAVDSVMELCATVDIL